MGNTIGRRLALALSMRERTQADLGAAIGLHQSTVSLYVSGARTMPAKHAAAAGRFLGVPTGWLLTGTPVQPWEREAPDTARAAPAMAIPAAPPPAANVAEVLSRLGEDLHAMRSQLGSLVELSARLQEENAFLRAEITRTAARLRALPSPEAVPVPASPAEEGQRPAVPETRAHPRRPTGSG